MKSYVTEVGKTRLLGESQSREAGTALPERLPPSLQQLPEGLGYPASEPSPSTVQALGSVRAPGMKESRFCFPFTVVPGRLLQDPSSLENNFRKSVLYGYTILVVYQQG